MFALHPGSLPPKGARETQRIEVTAADLVRLYKIPDHEWIVWDPHDGYDWFDFIHLYPSHYGRYTLDDGDPSKDVPCNFSSDLKAGRLPGFPAATRTRGRAR